MSSQKVMFLEPLEETETLHMFAAGEKIYDVNDLDGVEYTEFREWPWNNYFFGRSFKCRFMVMNMDSPPKTGEFMSMKMEDGKYKYTFIPSVNQ